MSYPANRHTDKGKNIISLAEVITSVIANVHLTFSLLSNADTAVS